MRKMEIILKKDLLNENNDAKNLFKEEKKININEINYLQETEIVNLKNLVDDYKCKLGNSEIKYNKLLGKYKNDRSNKKNLIIFFLNLIIIILGVYIYRNRKN